MGPVIRHCRARLASYAIALAVCQVAAVVSGTVVLAASAHSSALGVSAGEECTCEHTAGVMCPMHRKSSSRPVPTDAPRWCKGVDDSAFAVLPALGALAWPERIAQILPPDTASIVAAPVSGAPIPLARPPDSPPPRV